MRQPYGGKQAKGYIRSKDMSLCKQHLPHGPYIRTYTVYSLTCTQHTVCLQLNNIATHAVISRIT